MKTDEWKWLDERGRPLFFDDRSSVRVLAWWFFTICLLPLLTSTQLLRGSQSTNLAAAPSTNYVITSTGANQRVWQKSVAASTNDQGEVSYLTSSYTELATGMNFLVGTNWVPSSETIQITTGGGIATNGQHQVGFAANINASNAVEIVTPDGKALMTHILGLSYYDSAIRSNVLIAELKDSIGQLVASNQVVYPDAFTDHRMDVRYTYRRSGLEQDIIVQEQLPSPAAFGLTPSSTRLQVWTEFLNPPTPAITPMANGTDIRLDFGAMRMSRGKAFILGSNSMSVPVQKEWVTNQGRTFLIEEVPFNSVAPQLQTLPAPSGTNGNDIQQIRYQGFPKNLPPASKLARRTDESLMAARAPVAPEKGLVLDYDLTGGYANLTLQGDTTYYVADYVTVYGVTTIEGGAVVKYADGGYGYYIDCEGPIVCQTGPYQPAIFTSMDDNSVGQVIGGSSGSPATGTSDYYLLPDDGVPTTLSYLRFNFAFSGLTPFGTEVDVWDCQFDYCNNAIDYYTDSNLHLHNVLFGGDAIGVHFEDYAAPVVTAEHLTADCTSLAYYVWFQPTFYLTNSVIVAGFPSPVTLYTNDVIINPPVTPFQTVGAGNYYLATNSPYRDAGTTNISAALLNELSRKTTYPPITPASFAVDDIRIYATNMTLSPVAQRDTDTPDLGFHYDPIDYMVSWDYSNCVVTLTNGVAFGYWRNLGISLDNNGQLVSQGTPTQRNVIAYFALVQEQPVSLGGSDYPADAFPVATWHPNPGSDPSIYIQFTSIYAPQVCANIFYTYGNYIVHSFTARDVETYGGGAGWTLNDSSGLLFGLTNDLFQYTQVSAAVGGTWNAFNNLYRGDTGDTYSISSSGGAITNRDNAFDGTSVTLAGTNGHNAFWTSSATYITPTPNTNNDIVTNLTWLAGPLGYFYQTTNSPLIDKGSRTADVASLYHYTTQTSEVKETNSTVDIGYHYVALDANGNPDDSNGDGIPDYLEDTNGDGVYDAGDLGNWAPGSTVSDSTGQVNLQVYTPLR